MGKTRRAPIIGIVIPLLLAACGKGGDTPPVYPDSLDPASRAPLAVVGDLQRTSAIERLIGREQNDVERERIVAALTRERPAGVVLLGDLVFDAADVREWNRLDSLTAPLREAAGAILPVLGNHEYRGNNAWCLEQARARFPPLRQARWYSRRFGNLGLVWLDSNATELDSTSWNRQLAWYRQTLADLDRAAEVKGVLVFLHHPPFTNSTVTGDEAHVQKAFLPPFRTSRKAVAMLCGHAHAYEHFLKHGKHFIVSGGGGGPRVALLSGQARRHRDLFEGPAPRPFHYILIQPRPAAVHVIVKGFAKGEREVRTIDAFDLRLAGR
jgi:3',5'-cyclic AMP phosphodiesterase CpdA